MCACRGAPGKGLVAPLVHLLVSGGPSDQARAARALSNMATDSAVKEQIVAAGLFAFSYAKILSLQCHVRKESPALLEMCRVWDQLEAQLACV